MARDRQDFSTPQEAIEGYLEALLQDVAEYDEADNHPTAEAAEDSHPADSSEPLSSSSADSAPDEMPDSDAELTGFSAEAEQPSDPQTEYPAAEAEHPADDSGFTDTADGAVFENKESGTRVFAPPSARQYARDAAAQIQQRRQALQQAAPEIETALQDQPPVMMPELKIAEPEVQTATETLQDTDVESQVLEQTEILTDTEIGIEEEIGISEPDILSDAELADQALAEMTAAVEQEIAQDQQVAEEQQLAVQENEGWTDGRPDWAQGRFECLLFVVKGLKLAVPLAELGGIHKLEKEPTPLFGQPGWFLGIVRTNGMNVGLVDTAQWVMSEHISDDHRPDFRFAIRIHNSEWGLACHEVAEAISLDPSEVKWRTKLGRRPWLAGTVVDHMCALIDVAAFARLLDSDKVPVDLQALMADAE